MDEHLAEDYEEFEESTYVIMDFDYKEWDSAPKPGQRYSIIGFDTEETFLHSNGDTFRGEYHNSCGTDIIFDTIPDSDTLVPLATTFKKLKFTKVTLTDNPEKESACEAGQKEDGLAMEQD